MQNWSKLPFEIGFVITWSPKNSYAPRVVYVEEWEEAYETLRGLSRGIPDTDFYMVDIHPLSIHQESIVRFHAKNGEIK